MRAPEKRRHLSATVIYLILGAVAVVCLLQLLPEPVAPGGSVVSAGSSPCLADVNLDGLRDVRDLVLIQAHILGTKSLNTAALANADVNQDSLVDVRDLVHLLMNQLGRSQLAECEPVVLEGGPEIRLIAPSRGPTGTRFTLVGRNFSPVLSENFVMFTRPGEAFMGAVDSSTGNSIVGVVPESLNFQL